MSNLPQTSILQSSTPTAQYGRKMKRSDYRTIPHRWYQVLALHLAGKKVSEIQKETGYAPATVYRILNEEEVIGARQQLLDYYDKEFEALFPQVIDAIRKGLASSDRYLEAVEKWSKLSGKGTASQKGSSGPLLSAENVALVILQQAQANQGQEEADQEMKDCRPKLEVYDADS